MLNPRGRAPELLPCDNTSDDRNHQGTVAERKGRRRPTMPVAEAVKVNTVPKPQIAPPKPSPSKCQWALM